MISYFQYLSCQVVAKEGPTKDEQSIELDPSTTISDAVCAGIFISFFVEPKIYDSPRSGEAASTSSVTSAFQVLMANASQKDCVPDKLNGTNGNARLYNDIIDWLVCNKLGWQKQSVPTVGKEFVTILCDVLWYIDGHHVTLKDRGNAVPGMFAKFQGYNMPEKHKHRKREGSNLKSSVLLEKSSALFRMCGSTYLKGATVASHWLRLADNLRKHSEYLDKQNATVKLGHDRKVRRIDQHEWEVYGTMPIPPTMKARYGTLHDSLVKSPLYTPVFLNNFAPTDARRRYEFIQGLAFPCKTVRFSYTSCREHLHFVWRLSGDESDAVLLQRNDEVSDALKAEFPKYFNRTMRRTFLDTFGRCRSCSQLFSEICFEQ